MNQPIITIFCSFTRRWAVDDWIKDLATVKHDPALTNLCFIVDCNEHYILTTLRKFAEENNYRSCHVRINEEWSPNEVRLAIRRARIAEVKNQSKELIAQADGEIVISLEDDTVMARLDSFDSLINPLLWDNAVGFVEGVQMGRWGANIIGAWQVDDIDNPLEIKTLLPKTGYEEISGGGFYGYATRKNLYLSHDYFTSTAQPHGPDVNYGIWLNRLKYKCLIDWNTVFGHNDFGNVAYPEQHKLAQVIFNKNLSTGKWERTDNEPNRY